MRFHKALAVLAAGCAIGVAHAQSPAPTLVRVIAFDGGWNLPIWAAQRQGLFEASGITVQLSYTPSSAFLVQSLFDGKSDIATAAIDNLVAYQEGQGEAKIPDDPDLFAFMGCDGGFATVVAAPADPVVPALADVVSAPHATTASPNRRVFRCDMCSSP